MANENVISFKDAVIELQRLNKTAKEQQRQTENTNDLQRMVVAIDAYGEKTLVEEEKYVEQQYKLSQEQAKETKSFQEKSISALKEISATLTNISKTIETSLVGSKISTEATASLSGAEKQGTELTENQEEAARIQEEHADKQEYLIDKLIVGIAGLKDVSEKGFKKMAETFKEGSGEGGGILGGIKSLFEGGKGLLSGGIKGVGGKLAGAARGGLNMISKAGPLATVAGVGLAATSLYDSVATNIDKSNEIEENVKSGALTRSQGNVLQGESLGDTAGTAAGATIGGIAGSALGPLGAAAGAWLGGKVGGWAGGKIGKYGVKAYQGLKNMLGFGESKEQEQAKMTPEQKLMNQYTSGEINEDEYNKRMKLQVEGGAQPAEPPPVSTTASKAGEAAGALTATSLAETPKVTTPTQEPSGATGTGVLDKIKSGAGRAAMVAMPGVGLAYMAGKSIAGKASEWGKGIKDWFGGTKVGQALADRNKGVGAVGVGETMPEMLVGSKENLTETMTNDSSSRQLNEGITTEKSALGSKWLGKLIAGKGTETENFLANSETADDKGGKYSQFMGKRTEGGWFSKDKYSITGGDGKDVTVDKDTYMQAKKIASEGGDSSKIGDLISAYTEKNKAAVEPVTNEMGDVIYGKSVAAEDAKENAAKPAASNAVVNAPTVVNNTTNSTNTMRSPIKNEEASVNRYLRSRFA